MEIEDVSYEFERDRTEYLATIRKQEQEIEFLQVKNTSMIQYNLGISFVNFCSFNEAVESLRIYTDPIYI